MANIIAPGAPVLLDAAALTIQTTMAKLPWLDNAFGLAEMRVRERDGRRYKYPGVLTATGYIDLTPHVEHGNYMYVTRAGDSYALPDQRGRMRAEVRLNVFLDLQAAGLETTEEALAHVLARLSYCPVGVLSMRYGLEFDELESQYLMWPYTGFSVLCLATYAQPCTG